MRDNLPQLKSKYLIVRIKNFSPAFFGMILVCSFFPFVNLSCQGQKILSLTGIQLITGTKVEKNSLGRKQQGQEIKGESTAIFVFLPAILGIGVFLLDMRKKSKAMGSGILGSAGLIMLLLLKAKLDNDILREGRGILHIEYGLGFWFILALYISIIGLNTFIFTTIKDSEDKKKLKKQISQENTSLKSLYWTGWVIFSISIIQIFAPFYFSILKGLIIGSTWAFFYIADFLGFIKEGVHLSSLLPKPVIDDVFALLIVYMVMLTIGLIIIYFSNKANLKYKYINLFRFLVVLIAVINSVMVSVEFENVVLPNGDPFIITPGWNFRFRYCSMVGAIVFVIIVLIPNALSYLQKKY